MHIERLTSALAVVVVLLATPTTMGTGTSIDVRRQLSVGEDIVTDVAGVVVDKVLGEVIEADEIRKVYYRCAMKQLRAAKHSSATWARIHEEDAELETMKRQKDDQVS